MKKIGCAVPNERCDAYKDPDATEFLSFMPSDYESEGDETESQENSSVTDKGNIEEAEPADPTSDDNEL